jgi:hypothetical protein
MLVHFREKISADLVNKVNRETVKKMLETTSSDNQKKTEELEKEGNPPKNCGKLILDATCAPGDISYPTDLGILNQGRKQTEKIIDFLLSRVFYAFLCLFFKNRLFLEIDIIEHYDFASHRQQKLIFNQA